MAGSGVCDVDECDKVRHSNGLCQKHARRLAKFGTTDATKGCRGRSAEERFWPLVDVAGPDDCWLWTGGKGGTAKYVYGIFRLEAGGKTYTAHRYAYMLANGEIPDGMEVDHRHTCPKLCANPAHLRLVTSKQNKENLRGGHGRSGFRGVRFDRGKWVATVGHNGKQHYLGRFSTPEEAGEVARLKRVELFTHNDADRAG
ncbi:HNH endonuclease [Mycobacterium phage Vorrps]|nr:HNH endonuclease [Mycobacterium phage Vorrps]UAW08404.1 HNH endonuclease [Mycobacterium phage Mori]